MSVAIGADHAGYALKQELVAFLRSEGQAVERSRHLRFAAGGLSRCGRVGGSRGAVRRDGARRADLRERRGGICRGQQVRRHPRRPLPRHLLRPSGSRARRHERAGAGARVIGVELAQELVRAFLEARFTHEERHQRRLGKIKALEEEVRRHAP